MIDKKNVWAVVCGAVRQEFELLSVMTWLCVKRAEGYIDGIVLSTWIGEINNIPNLRNRLEYIGVHIVESPLVSDDIETYFNLNYTRQAIQLDAGLRIVPDDVFVLKCRTDMSMDMLNKMKEVLYDDVNLTLIRYGEIGSHLSYKIAVGTFGVSIPFVLCDLCYLGYKEDIKKMINFENTRLSINDGLAPDILFFYQIFAHKIGFIKEFFSIVDVWRLNRFFEMLETKKQEDIVLPGILNKFYALYFLILYSCFYLVDSQFREIGQIEISDVLFCNKQREMDRDWISYIKNPIIVEKCIKGEWKITTGYIKLYQEICKMAYPDYVKSLSISKKDYTETIEFCNNTEFKEKSFLKQYKKITDNKIVQLSSGDVIDILYSNYYISDMNNFKNTIENIINNKKYYSNIIKQINNLNSIVPGLAESALLAASRTKEPEVLKIIAQKLFYRELSPSNINAAAYIFKRNENTAAFYKQPMSTDKIIALYYYGKYAESLDDDTVAKNFYNRLISDYKLSNEHSHIIKYSDAIIDIIREIVMERYENYYSDSTIKNMIVFLVSVCETNPFPEKIILFLKNNSTEMYEEVKKKYENIGA